MVNVNKVWERWQAAAKKYGEDSSQAKRAEAAYVRAIANERQQVKRASPGVTRY